MIRNVYNPRTEVSEGTLVMKVAENTTLGVVNDSKYLGAYIANCHVDFKRRRGLATCMEPVLEVSDSLEIKGDFIVIKITSF